MLLVHELKLKNLEVHSKASLRAPMFFDPIAEGLYAEAIYEASNSPRWPDDLVIHVPQGTSTNYVILSDGTVLCQCDPGEMPKWLA